MNDLVQKRTHKDFTVKLNGIPCVLPSGTIVMVHPGNVDLICDEPQADPPEGFSEQDRDDAMDRLGDES